MRVLVVWCPDWSVVAALREAEPGRHRPRRRCSRPAWSRSATARPARRACGAASAAATPRRAAPSSCCCRRQPRPRRARLRAGAGGGRGAATRASPALRPGLLAVRAPGRWFGGEENAAAVVAETLVEAGVWDCRLGVADDLFTAEQAARRARRAGVRGGAAAAAPPRTSRDLPVEVLEADGAEGREAVSLLRRLGLRTLGDLAALPADAVQHRFGRYGARVWRRARGEDAHARRPAHPAARPDRRGRVRAAAGLGGGGLLQRPHDGRAAGRRAGLAPAGGHRRAGRGGARRRGRLGAHLAAPAVLLAPATSSTACTGSCRPRRGVAALARTDAGAVRAPVERVRFLPEVVEPAAAHTEGLWGGGGDELVQRGVARVQAMVGFDAVDPSGAPGRALPRRPAGAVPWGERAAGLRPLDRPWPGRLPGPAPVRVFAAPRCRPRCSTTGARPWWSPSAAWSPASRPGSGSRAPTGAGLVARPAWAGPVAGRRVLVVRGARSAARFQLVGSTAGRGCWSAAGRLAGRGGLRLMGTD